MTEAERPKRLPPRTQAVELRMACCGGEPHATVVEGLCEDEVWVSAAFTHPGEPELPVYADRVVVSWAEPTGWMEMPTQFVGTVGETMPMWRLFPVGEELQRRAYVRVTTAVPAHLFTTGEATPATVLDISEGGMRVALSAAVEIDLEDELEAVVSIENEGSVTTLCHVVRDGTLSGNLRMIAFRFVGLPERDAARVRRYVFRKQLRMARMKDR